MGKANLLYGVKDASNVRFIGKISNEIAVDLDYANNFEINLKEDGREYAMVDGKTKAVAFDGEKSGELTVGVDLMNTDLFAFITRSKLLKGVNKIFKTESFTITEDNQTVELKEIPTALVEVCTLRADGGKKQRLNNSALDVDKKVITSGSKIGDKVKVYYFTEKNVNHLTVTGNSQISENYEGYADVIGKTWAGGEEMPFQYHMYNVAPQVSIDLKYDGSKVCNFEFKFDLLSDTDEEKSMVDYTEVDEDTEQITETATIPSILIAVGDDTANTVTLGFEKPENASSVILKYTDDDEVTWKDVDTTGSLTEISISAPLDSTSKNVVISNFTTANTYKFKLVVDGIDSAISDAVTFTV